jgi:hypothetical protein
MTAPKNTYFLYKIEQSANVLKSTLSVVRLFMRSEMESMGNILAVYSPFRTLCTCTN